MRRLEIERGLARKASEKEKVSAVVIKTTTFFITNCCITPKFR